LDPFTDRNGDVRASQNCQIKECAPPISHAIKVYLQPLPHPKIQGGQPSENLLCEQREDSEHAPAAKVEIMCPAAANTPADSRCIASLASADDLVPVYHSYPDWAAPLSIA
jgi:hypothetical protein